MGKLATRFFTAVPGMDEYSGSTPMTTLLQRLRGQPHVRLIVAALLLAYPSVRAFQAPSGTASPPEIRYPAKDNTN